MWRNGIAIQGTVEMEGVTADDLVLDDNYSVKAQISNCKKSVSYEWRTCERNNSSRHKSQSRRKSTLSIGWKDRPWSWSSNPLASWCEELTHWKRSWCWERSKAGGEGDNRGWDGWMASPTQWMLVWAISGSWWRTEEPGVLQSMGSWIAGHDLVTEQQQA